MRFVVSRLSVYNSFVLYHIARVSFHPRFQGTLYARDCVTSCFTTFLCLVWLFTTVVCLSILLICAHRQVAIRRCVGSRSSAEPSIAHILSPSCVAMADRKAVIKNADMAEDMQQDAIDCATQALEKYNIEKDIAAFIKKEFDKKYNPTWHCIVGRNFGSYVTHETKHFIYFYLGQVAVLLFKSG